VCAAGAKKKTRIDETQDMDMSDDDQDMGDNQMATAEQEAHPPHKILFVPNVPASVTVDMMTRLFQQYAQS
jgi:hypothetical protein